MRPSPLFIPFLLQLALLISPSLAKLECDPTSDTKKADPANPESYLYCNLEGSFSRRKCINGKVFDNESGECVSVHHSEDASDDDPFAKPFFQAPDDLCGGGIPLTILSAPVACNPSISSCPDGYMCRMYERTGTSYCCQGASSGITDTSSAMCSKDQVTFIDVTNNRPRSCVLSSDSSCPVGFGCNLVAGTTTRCCGKDLGCPFNSAALLNPSTASHVECSPGARSSCQSGFECVRSSMLNKHICCSVPEGEEDLFECPNGQSPLKGSCSASKPCSNGYVCKNGRCCPAIGVCPAGQPLGGGPTVCSEKNPCRQGYECVTNTGIQYCCPSKKAVCSQKKHAGTACASSRPATTRYYFDLSTSTCRSFQFSQCGGNSNNFDSLEECEGFCVDTQCPAGQAYRIGAVNAGCEMTSQNTCPRQYACEKPLFGNNPICCPSAELTCNEMVSAGTPCFGRSITIQRYYFNPSTRKCTPFQYYGCNGNGNNFGSMDDCNNHCLNVVDDVCNGAGVLMDPNQQPQRCSSSVPCPSGYECNPESYCCPTVETSCNSPATSGSACLATVQRTMWQYDQASRRCKTFTYNGCGAANRFISEKACRDTCVHTSNLGSCPRGMTAFVERGEITPKSCTLNVLGTCPSSSSCVRSTSNQPICCQTVTTCPGNREAYVIPGSTSVVACNVDSDDCPEDFECMASSSVSGFHMCCSSSSNANQRPPSSPRGSRLVSRKEKPDSLAALIRSISSCPPGLQSNGQTCTVNAIGDCPNNHICFRDLGFEQGTCCRTTPPKCAQKTYIPVFVDKTQVQICQVDLAGCPRGSRCMTSTVPKLAICCKKYEPPSRNINTNSGTSKPVCSNGNSPYMNGQTMQECNFVHNTCPSGYKCEFSSTGRAVCCGDSESIRCPAGSSVFEYGGRPLACPPGSNKCPMSYSCMASPNPMYHLCCSSGGSQVGAPQCANGVAFVDPLSNERQFCSPMMNNCPTGYHCMASDRPGQFICCTQGDLSDRFRGFCPTRQIPYISRDGFPPTCHMQLNPCPTTAPYICIYSPEKQDSFCCAPIDTAVRSMIPTNAAARPMKKITPFGEQVPEEVTPEEVIPGMTQTFVGGPIAPGMGPIGVPDPIPGVDLEKVMPPGYMAKTLPPPPAVNQQPLGGVITIVQGGQQGHQVNQGSTSEVNNFSFAGGCPLGSRPLVRTDRSVAECSEQPCPDGFACVYAEKEERFQCCSSSSIMLASGASQPKIDVPSTSTSDTIECPQGFYLIDEKCLKVLFAGQKGCMSDVQCAAKEANATCDSGYCICPVGKPLVHGGRCVPNCPEGFANIAGRCYDPTTVIFMDSVDERVNGTIGGYCLETLVEEKRCDVADAYCSEKTITCQCKPGFDLKMDFENPSDKGKCVQLESSKFQHSPPGKMAAEPEIDEELYFIDIGPAKVLEVGNSTANDDEDVNKYLFQTDQLIPVFA